MDERRRSEDRGDRLLELQGFGEGGQASQAVCGFLVSSHDLPERQEVVEEAAEGVIPEEDTEFKSDEPDEDHLEGEGALVETGDLELEDGEEGEFNCGWKSPLLS